MTVGLLYFATGLVGLFWIYGQWIAARKEFTLIAQQRTWMIASTLLFLMIVTFSLTSGQSGLLSDFSRTPPPFAAFFLFIWAAAFYCAFSRFGDALVKHVPIYLMIGFQAFRILAEWVIYRAVHEGLAPVQLSFEGYNYDIITALTAVPVAILAYRKPASPWLWAWNFMGFALLLNVAFIAVTSMPLSFRLFENEPSNVWITATPYILLPGVLVTAAIAGHLITWRKLKLRL